MYPHPTDEVQGTLARDVELAKAAVLYADHVDLISAQAHTLQYPASMQDSGLAAMTALITDLNERTLQNLGMDTSDLTPEIRDQLPTLMEALEVPQVRAVLPPEMQQVYASLAAPLAEFREVVGRLAAESGGNELNRAIAADLLRVVDLSGTGNLVASAVDAAAGTTSGAESFGSLAVSWAEELFRLLQEQAITEDADDLWVESVAPALVDLEDALTEHGLVKEMARRARADARALVLGGPSFLIGLQEIGHLSAAVSALVSGGSLAAGVVGPAMNDWRASASENKRAEMYYLYRLGQVGV